MNDIDPTSPNFFIIGDASDFGDRAWDRMALATTDMGFPGCVCGGSRTSGIRGFQTGAATSIIARTMAEERSMSIALIVIDAALAILGLQWLSGVVDPNTFGLILFVVVVLFVLHLIRHL